MSTEPINENRRQNDQWIRDGLREQRECAEAIRKEMTAIHHEVEAIRKDLIDVTDTMLSAIPNKSPVAHVTAHSAIEQDLAARNKKAEEDAKLRTEVRNGLIKTVINAVLIFLFGVFLLGAQSQFGTWMDKARPSPVVTLKEAAK
jgi:hypothetical protein